MPASASNKTAADLQKRTGLNAATAKDAFERYGYAGGLVSFVQCYASLPDSVFDDRSTATKEAASINAEVKSFYSKAREVKGSSAKTDNEVWKVVEQGGDAASPSNAAAKPPAEDKPVAKATPSPFASAFGAATPKSAFGAPADAGAKPAASGAFASAFGAKPAAASGAFPSAFGAKPAEAAKPAAEKPAADVSKPAAGFGAGAAAAPKSAFGAPADAAAKPAAGSGAFASAFGAKPAGAAGAAGGFVSAFGAKPAEGAKPTDAAKPTAEKPAAESPFTTGNKPAAGFGAGASTAPKSAFGAPADAAAKPAAGSGAFASAFGAKPAGAAGAAGGFVSAFGAKPAEGAKPTDAAKPAAEKPAADVPKPAAGFGAGASTAPKSAFGAPADAGAKPAVSGAFVSAFGAKPAADLKPASPFGAAFQAPSASPSDAAPASGADKPSGFNFSSAAAGAPVASAFGFPAAPASSGSAEAPAFGSGFGAAAVPAQPQEDAPPKKPVKYCEPDHFTGPFLDMPNFWAAEVVGRAPLLNKNNGFLEAHRDELRPRLLKWVDRAAFYKRPVQYVEIEDEDEEVVRVIIKDADRTFFAPEHRRKMVVFLNAMFHEFGAYGQAMSYLAGLCMLALNEEETAAILRFVSTEYIKGHWAAEAVGFATSAWVVEYFMKKKLPDVAAHLDKLNFWPDTYLQKILTGLCIHVLEFEQMFDFLDAFMAQGFKYLIRFSIAVAEHFRTELLSVPDSTHANTVYEIMRLDSHVADKEDIRAILERAPKIDLGEEGEEIAVIRSHVYTVKIEPRLQRAPKAPTFEPCDMCGKNPPTWWSDEVGMVCDACKLNLSNVEFEPF